MRSIEKWPAASVPAIAASWLFWSAALADAVGCYARQRSAALDREAAASAMERTNARMRPPSEEGRGILPYESSVPDKVPGTAWRWIGLSLLLRFELESVLVFFQECAQVLRRVQQAYPLLVVKRDGEAAEAVDADAAFFSHAKFQ